ncbi:TPA: hypothetical protein SI882_004397 [Salmonella enterica]|nr:hypothetical protein [Salmonella enterica subsp. enterica serovar Typhimurium]QQO86894.1 hypothetical protein JIPKCDKL_00011 [Salmonella phage vB_SenS_BPS2]QQO88949.1 hypothetical protein EONOIOGO_00013 [Salmonella phage vB_SenS_BPS4]HEI4500730.1 hypothetical protein [Salmonella enterica]
MAGLWFFVVTMCGAVGADNMASDCHDYVIDAGISYDDCRAAVATYPGRIGLYSVRCDRGEAVEGGNDE